MQLATQIWVQKYIARFCRILEIYKLLCDLQYIIIVCKIEML